MSVEKKAWSGCDHTTHRLGDWGSESLLTTSVYHFASSKNHLRRIRGRNFVRDSNRFYDSFEKGLFHAQPEGHSNSKNWHNHTSKLTDLSLWLHYSFGFQRRDFSSGYNHSPPKSSLCEAYFQGLIKQKSSSRLNNFSTNTNKDLFQNG
jgi:hypothetical protein